MTEKISLNYGWEFSETWTEEFRLGSSAEDSVLVDLPHTCRTTPYNYFSESIYEMDCGYRRRLRVPPDWAGKRVFLTVEAAGHRAEVWVDGQKLAEHRCGYTSFRTELTGALTPGTDALLSLRVDSRESLNQPPFGFVIDYMTYGGLYREVWLEVTEPCYISDVFARPQLPGTLDSTVSLSGPRSPELALRQRLLNRENLGELLGELRLPVSEDRTELRMETPGAKPWSPENPSLYLLVTELLEGERLLDRRVLTVGFRRAEWRADGFYLNGEKLKLVGLNRHQSYPYVGYAAPASLQRYDADILKKELGVNAVRTSHYPQSRHFIDRCDELGLLVFTEIPGWQHIGDREWKNQAVENVREMVTQYRNHPSVILWGVRINESADDDPFYVRTNAMAHTLDPTRATGGVRCIKKSSLLEDVYTYNDFVHDGASPGCLPKRKVTPDMDKAYLITEYGGHMFPTKAFDSEPHRLDHALRHAAVLDAVAGEEDVAGSFGWCMFDYNTHKDFGSGDRICYHGVLDMFRNPKTAAAVYAARLEERPVLELSSNLDLGENPTGNRGRVFAFTNADELRFYINGRLVHTYTHDDSPYRRMWRGPIEIDDFVGDALTELEGFPPEQAALVKDLLNHAARFGFAHLPPAETAKAALLMTRWHMSLEDANALYGKYIGGWGSDALVFRFDAVVDGEVVKSVRKEPAAALRLRAVPSHTELREAGTYDAALVRITMTDQNGSVLPFYQEGVKLRTRGPIQLLGPDTAQLRGGMGGTLLRSLGESGEAFLRLSAPGAEPVTLRFRVSGHRGG